MRIQAPIAAGTAVNTSLLHWVPAVGQAVADRHNHKLDATVDSLINQKRKKLVNCTF